MKEIESIIQNLVQEIMELDDAPAIEAHLANDIGVASIDFVELGVALDRKFSINVPDDIFTRHHSIQSLAQYVGTYQATSNV